MILFSNFESIGGLGFTRFSNKFQIIGQNSGDTFFTHFFNYLHIDSDGIYLEGPDNSEIYFKY